MRKPLKGARIAFLVANEGAEQVELERPWRAVEQAGATPLLVAPEPGLARAFNHLDPGDSFAVDLAVRGVDVAEFDALVLPGGVASPDQLRTDRESVALVRAFVTSDKTVASICHAPWTLVEAGVVEGRTLTSAPSLRTDITNAGGTWVDQPVCVDHGLVSSREPGDLAAFCDELIAQVSAARVPTISRRGTGG